MPQKKSKQLYVCTNCDAQFLKWSGRCLECGSWGSLQLQQVGTEDKEEASSLSEPATAIELDKIQQAEEERIKVGIGEMDRVLGGGVVPGSLTLFSGDPGSGKSTMLAQVVDKVRENHSRQETVYISGEESAGQVKARLQRLGCNIQGLKFINETDVDKIIAKIREIKPVLVVVDSIQTMHSSDSPSEAGGVNQIRTATGKFLQMAKDNNIATFLIGHITKDGQVAGPKSLEHIVDTVLHLENEKVGNYSVLRSTKNRFGSVNEVGIFEMTGTGFREMTDPSGIFIDQQRQKLSGSVVSCVVEGTRPFMVDVQALVTKTVFGYPQRKASGLDANRLQILASVLTKRTKLDLVNYDIVLNIVGGLKVEEPALDMAACLAIGSSVLNQTVEGDTLVVGEVGLGGEIRAVPKLDSRLQEAEKRGFSRALIPSQKTTSRNLKLEKISHIQEILDMF